MTAKEKYDLADELWREHERDKAWVLFVEAYQEGYLPAANAIGDFYFYGILHNRDYAEAIRWFSIGADAGIPLSFHAIGSAYYQLNQYSLAISWYRKAIEHGYGPAYYDLGFMFENGIGVSVDAYMAIMYYKEGAALNDVDCMRALGNIYNFSGLVAANTQEARYWYKRAADEGDKDSELFLSMLT